jgi:regulator of RNase E activity RraA
MYIIGCGDVPVFPDGIVAGDAEAIDNLPIHLANEVAEEVHEMTAYEDIVEEKVLNGASIKGLYPASKEETLVKFSARRRENNRRMDISV